MRHINQKILLALTLALGSYQSAAIQTHLHDTGQGAILDLNTGLMWQKSGSFFSLNWSDAISYCESLGLTGQSDWRLPRAKELVSLVTYRRGIGIGGTDLLDTRFFTSRFSSPIFWSITPAASTGAAQYWAFMSSNGGLVKRPATLKFNTRCVRSLEIQ